MARPRSPSRKDLPDNCYLMTVGAHRYYRYKHPLTKKFHPLGKDRSAALRAARILNAKLLVTPTAEALVTRVTASAAATGTTIDEYAGRMEETILPARRSKKGKPLSKATMDGNKRMLARIRSALGQRPLATITRREISEFLDPFPPFYRNNLRSLLHDMMANAVAEGHRDDNPVAGTLKSDAVVARRRLTYDEFKRVREVSEPWFQLVLDIALLTLQRREDISKLTTQDLRDGYIYIEQGKTGKRLRIRYEGSELEPILSPLAAASGESGSSPRRLIRTSNAKARYTASPDMITRAFAAAWEKAIGPRGASDPTFHEIRALGASLYEAKGINPQRLLGHADASMTRWYLDRHQVQWEDVVLQ